MGKVKIYLSIVDGTLYYRDSEDDHGHKIDSTVDPGDKVVWKLDKDSGIEEITDIKINGSSDFFSKGPTKKDSSKWKAVVSEQATGTIEYIVSTIPACEDNKSISTKSPIPKNCVETEDNPKISIKD